MAPTNVDTSNDKKVNLSVPQWLIILVVGSIISSAGTWWVIPHRVTILEQRRSEDVRILREDIRKLMELQERSREVAAAQGVELGKVTAALSATSYNLGRIDKALSALQERSK